MEHHDRPHPEQILITFSALSVEPLNGTRAPSQRAAGGIFSFSALSVEPLNGTGRSQYRRLRLEPLSVLSLLSR